nr:ribosome maturation factor RimM [Tepidiformaceae bacterium]
MPGTAAPDGAPATPESGPPAPGASRPAPRPPRGGPRRVLPEPSEGHTAVGLVLRPHGLKGELRVQTFSPDAPNLQRGRWVTIRGERRRIVASREDRGAWLVLLGGSAGRTEAEALRGALIEVPDKDVRRSDSDSYFVHELIGLRVETSSGEHLGQLTEVLQPGANHGHHLRIRGEF